MRASPGERLTAVYDALRPEEKAKLVAEGPDDVKVSVALVAKALGQRWKTLSDEEKESYKVLAAAANAAAAEEKQKHAVDNPQDEDAAEEQDAGSAEDMLPLALLKRIIHCDSDVSRVSHDALVLIAMSAELFLGSLSKRVLPIAKRQKRRTIKLEDVEQVIKSDRRLVVAGLKDVVSMVVQLREERAAAAETTKENGSQEHEGDAELDEQEGEQQDKAEDGKQKSKRGRPAGAGNAGGTGSKKGKKVTDSTAGISRIDTFFSKKVQAVQESAP